MDSGKLSREELIAIVAQLCAGDGTEDELSDMLTRLETAVPGVRWQNLIYWPSGYPHDSSAPEPTPEEIVDRGLAQRRIIITPPPGST